MSGTLIGTLVTINDYKMRLPLNHSVKIIINKETQLVLDRQYNNSSIV